MYFLYVSILLSLDQTPQQKITEDKYIFIFDLLAVVLSIEKWAYHETSHVMYCHVKLAFFLTYYVFGARVSWPVY